MIVTAMMLTMAAMARPVDPATARRVAEVYLQAQGMRNTAALVDVTSETPFTEFYIFAAPEGGFVLVSGDDCVIPVLGYSATTRFVTKEMPKHVRAWLQACEEEIRWWKNREAGNLSQAGSPQPLWPMLEAGQMPEPQVETSVSPLLTTTWNQSPYYNEFCPYDSASDALVVAGCVAIATAQVMKYWNYPATGYGSHTYTSQRTIDGVTYTYPNLTADFGATTYDWTNMPNALTGASSTTEVNAVATLAYHVGVAVEMEYSPTFSGAYNFYDYDGFRPSSQLALAKYFKYRPDMTILARDDYSDAEFCARLRAELDQSRPILFHGYNLDDGHSFVIDGYNNDGLFHVNWGWGGYNDGYFPMGSLNPGVGGIGGNSSGTYNMYNAALIGIQPNPDWDTTSTTTFTTVSNGSGTIGGSGTFLYGDTVSLWASANAGNRFGGWSDGCKYNPRKFFANGGSYTVTANFDSVMGDTLHYCPGNSCLAYFGYPEGNVSIWGIRLPKAILADSATLKAVQFYVASAGTYQLTVYTGGMHAVTAATTMATYYENDLYQWQTIVLPSPVNTSSDIWIVFSSSAEYPAAFTYGAGRPEAFLWGSGLDQFGQEWDKTAMIKGIFSDSVEVPAPAVHAEGPVQGGVNAGLSFSATATQGATITWSFPGGTPATANGSPATTMWSTAGVHQAIATVTSSVGSVSDTVEVMVVDYNAGDTISYCLDRPDYKGVAYAETWWGIMIPPQYLVYRDTLKEVLLYVRNAGDYTLNVHVGGNEPTGPVVYTKTYTFDDENDYVHCQLDSALAIDKTQNLWIIFYSTVPFAARACIYVDEPNSDWISGNNINWVGMHLWGPEHAMSWMMKAVTSKTVTPQAVVTVDDASPSMVRVNGRTITVMADNEATFYDVQGRLLATGNELTVDAAGVYLVRLGTATRKVVIK